GPRRSDPARPGRRRSGSRRHLLPALARRARAPGGGQGAGQRRRARAAQGRVGRGRAHDPARRADRAAIVDLIEPKVPRRGTRYRDRMSSLAWTDGGDDARGTRATHGEALTAIAHTPGPLSCVKRDESLIDLMEAMSEPGSNLRIA